MAEQFQSRCSRQSACFRKYTDRFGAVNGDENRTGPLWGSVLLRTNRRVEALADCLIKHRLYGNIKIHRNVYTFVNTFQGGETDGRDARKTKKETPPGRSPAFVKLPTD